MLTGKHEFKGDFDVDVPEHMQDNLLTRIIEAAYGYSEDPDIDIFEVEHIDETNIEFSGTITLEGKQHCFHICDGDRNGTEVISWNDEADLGIDHKPAPQLRNSCENSEITPEPHAMCPQW